MLLLDLMRMVGPGDGAGAGVLLILKIVRKGPIVLSVETGGCCLAIYFLSLVIFSSCSLFPDTRLYMN